MDLFQTAGTGHCAGGYCVPTGCIRADKTGQGGQALHVASHIQVAFGCDSNLSFPAQEVLCSERRRRLHCSVHTTRHSLVWAEALVDKLLPSWHAVRVEALNILSIEFIRSVLDQYEVHNSSRILPQIMTLVKIT